MQIHEIYIGCCFFLAKVCTFYWFKTIFLSDNLMSEIHVRTTETFTNAQNQWHNINSGGYFGGPPFDPALGNLCATITDVIDSEIRELYCQEMFVGRYVVLHSTGMRLQFCEIQVYDTRGKENHTCKEEI